MASWVDTTAPKQLLSVSRIDPVAETAKYSAEVMSSAGSGLDEQGKSLLAEDLRSPLYRNVCRHCLFPIHFCKNAKSTNNLTFAKSWKSSRIVR